MSLSWFMNTDTVSGWEADTCTHRTLALAGSARASVRCKRILSGMATSSAYHVFGSSCNRDKITGDEIFQEYHRLKITQIIWLRQYVIKLEAKHGVYPEEVRQILMGSPRIRRVGKGQSREGEHLYVGYGQTDAGRYLTVFFIHKSGNQALVISARDMDGKERKLYGKK